MLAVSTTYMALLVDPKSGFYTVVREIVRLQSSGEDIERVIESISAPAQLESALLRLMAAPSIVERHLVDGHLSALLSEAHTNTWFVVEGQSDVARAVEGSRPGCCLADFALNVAFAPALADVRRALSDAGYLWEPPSEPSLSSFGALLAVLRVWLVPTQWTTLCRLPSRMPMTRASAASFVGTLRLLLPSLAHVSLSLRSVLLRRGTVVNWDRGKSAALLEVRGALSRSAKRELFLEHGTCVSLPGADSVVYLERSYVHLGSDVCVGGSMGPAVAARVRAHAQATTPLRRCVCPRRVSTKAKLTFVDSVATSRLCHSAGAWDNLSKGQLDRMQASLVRGYRCAMSMPHRDPTRDRCANAEVVAACGKLGVSTRLSLARLRLLDPVLVHGPQALLRLCDYLAARGRGWPIAWLLVTLTWSIYTGAKALLARVLPPCLLGPILPRARLMCGNVDLTVLGAEPLLLMLIYALPGDVVLTASCVKVALTCPKVLPLSMLSVAFCATSAAVPLLLSAPGVPIVRRCMAPGILLEPWHSARCVVAAAWSFIPGRVCCGTSCTYSVSSCLAAYASFFMPCDDATVEAAEYSDRVESQENTTALPGCLPFASGCTLPPSTHGLDSLKGVLPPSVPDAHDVCAQRAPVSVHRYLDVMVYYVLRLFSGQRRPGDFQHWLDQPLSVTHYPVWVISLDAAIDAKLRDLSCSGSVARWLDLAIAGRVVMVLGGPPCETWSVAKWNGGSRATGSGPRAVRSPSSPLHLWGLHGLDAGERQQVALGNAHAYGHLVSCCRACVWLGRNHGAPTAPQLDASGSVLVETARVEVAC